MTFEEADAKYPYDPKARAEVLTGIAKLRAFQDPAMRRSVFLVFEDVLKRRREERQRERKAPPPLEDDSERRYP